MKYYLWTCGYVFVNETNLCMCTFWHACWMLAKCSGSDRPGLRLLSPWLEEMWSPGRSRFPHPEEGLSADLTQTLQPSGRKAFPDTSQTEWHCRFAFTRAQRNIHSFTFLWSFLRQKSLLLIIIMQKRRLSLHEKSLPIAFCPRNYKCFDLRFDLSHSDCFANKFNWFN